MDDDEARAREAARRAGRAAYAECQPPDHLQGREAYRFKQKAYVHAYVMSIRRDHYDKLNAKPCACRLAGIQMPGCPVYWTNCTSLTAGDPRSIFANGHSARMVTGFAKAHLAGGRLYHAESLEEPLTPMQLFARLGMPITEEQFLAAVERIRLYRFKVDGPEDYLAKITASWATRLLSGRADPRPWGQKRRILVEPPENPDASPSTP